jgi:hypothetical protein
MRLSMIRSGFAAIAVSIALMACGGHGMVPSQSLSQNSAVAPANELAVDVSPDASPCNVPGLYYFHGSCASFKLKTTAATTVPLGSKTPYKGIKITSTFSAMENPPKGVATVPAVLGDATGKGDITGQVKGKSFPLYGVGKDCVNPQGKAEFCPGKPFVYAQLINKSTHTLKPKDTPKFVISDANGYPGKRLCFPAILTSPGPHTVGGWAPNTTLGGQPHGTNLTINSQPNPGQLIFPPGAFIVTGACE